MTKVQNLSLNPTKISGVCGRLMCCLKYENDVYLELSKSVPKLNEKVESKEGLGKVIESNVLAGKIKVRIFTGEKDENGRDKLGSDIYTFDKNDVRRINKPNIQEKIEKKETEETDFEPELEDAQVMDILESEEKNFEKDLSLLPDFQIDEIEVGKNEEVPSEENASNENKPKRSRHRRPRRRSGSAPKSGERRDSAKQGAERKERSKDHVSNQQRNRNSRRPRKPAKQADKGNGNADKA